MSKSDNIDKSLKELENSIHAALKKINKSKTNALCHYLPASGGGYMHHFTFRKMSSEKPEELNKLIKKHVLEETHPKMVTPKPRATKGSRKRRDLITFNKNMLERMRTLALHAGDSEMVSLLNPPKSLATCRKELVASIKRNQIDEIKWKDWCQSVKRLHSNLEGSQLEAAIEPNYSVLIKE